MRRHRPRTVPAPPPLLLALALVVPPAQVGIAPASAYADVAPPFVQTTLASGLGRPISLAYAPDGRLFIGEQGTSGGGGSARIKIYKNGAVLATPFATITPVYRGHNESGLLGLAVDPDFANHPYLYAFVTETSSEQKIYRFTASGDVAPDKVAIVTGLPTQGVNHNGGGIGLGPDGKLYVAVGDGGPVTQAPQQTTNLRGKILRFERDGTPAAGNPFPNGIWTIGHRHPFRFCWSPQGTMFLTENGPSSDDEINVVVGGENYGWPNEQGIAGNPLYEDPILDFTPTIAPTGCVFYSAAGMPSLQGQLIFSNYNQSKIQRVSFATQPPSVSDLATRIPEPVDIAVAPDGSLTIASRSGSIYRINEAVVPNQAPVASFTATPQSDVVPYHADLDASASIDPDGAIVSYAWDFDDGSQGAGVQVTHVFNAPGNYTIRLTVTDDDGVTGTTTRTVSALSGTAPTRDAATIVEHRWSFGDGSPDVIVSAPGTDVNSVVDHVYTKAGVYRVDLVVTSSNLQTDTDSIEVIITAPPGAGSTRRMSGGGCVADPGAGAALLPSLAVLAGLALTARRHVRG